MTRTLYFILFLCATLTPYISYASHKPYIIRHNDGDITPLSISQIDSITFSHYDCDSIYHHSIVSQLVWTPDSIYMVSVSDIDKVDLTLPPNKLSKDVTDIKQNLYSYVTGCINDTILTLSAQTPPNLLPGIGENLIYDEMDEKLPIGFTGKVSAIKNCSDEIRCICERVSLSEIYDTYYNYSDAAMEIPEESPSYKKAPPVVSDRTLALAEVAGTVSLSKYASPWDCSLLETSANLETGIKIKPQIRIRHLRLVETPRVYESCLIMTDLGVETFLSLSCQAEVAPKFPIGKAGVNLPVAPFIRMEAEGGISVSLNGKIGVEATHDSGIRFIMQCDYDNSRLINPLRLNQAAMRILEPSFEARLFGEAEFKVAGYFEIGMALITGDLAKISAYEEGGLKISIDAPIVPSHILNCSTSTDLYRDLCSSTIKAAPFYAWGWEAEAVKGKLRQKEEIGITVLPDILSVPILPTLHNSRFSLNSSGYGEFSASISQYSLLRPSTWGATAFEINQDETVSQNASAEYSRDYGQLPLSYTAFLEPIDNTKKYRVFPTLNMFGRKILGEPYVDVEPSQSETEMVESVVYTTGECRRYYDAVTGEEGAFGMVCTAMTPTVSFKDLSLDYEEIEECRWEWGLDHPILSNGDSPDYDFWGDGDYHGWGGGWNYSRTPVFSQEINVSEILQPVQVFFPSNEGYDTPAIIHPNSIVEFYDNRFYLRLAVKLKSGETVYPVKSTKDFTYSYKCELYFKDFNFSYERVSETQVNYKFTVKGVYSGAFAIANSYWLGGHSIHSEDGTFAWNNDDRYHIPGYLSKKLEYRLFEKASYEHLNPGTRTEVSLGPAQGFTLYHAEYIDDCYDAPEQFQKNEPYFYWDSKYNKDWTISITDHGYGIRDRK